MKRKRRRTRRRLLRRRSWRNSKWKWLSISAESSSGRSRGAHTKNDTSFNSFKVSPHFLCLSLFVANFSLSLAFWATLAIDWMSDWLAEEDPSRKDFNFVGGILKSWIGDINDADHTMWGCCFCFFLLWIVVPWNTNDRMMCTSVCSPLILRPIDDRWEPAGRRPRLKEEQ